MKSHLTLASEASSVDPFSPGNLVGYRVTKEAPYSHVVLIIAHEPDELSPATFAGVVIWTNPETSMWMPGTLGKGWHKDCHYPIPAGSIIELTA